MSSILTNSSSLVALQTLKSINMGMNRTQNEISTGKSVATAKDNSAVWAISKVMEADVKGFKAISDSLSLGESTVAVARQAAETITDLLTEIKGKIVASQEQNVDRTKIQTDITNLSDQITSVVQTAQFNGLNMVSGFDSVEGGTAAYLVAVWRLGRLQVLMYGELIMAQQFRMMPLAWMRSVKNSQCAPCVLIFECVLQHARLEHSRAIQSTQVTVACGTQH